LTCEEANSMSSIALHRDDVIVGVDTHKHEHVAVVIDGLGGRLGDRAVPATVAGYEELVGWARSWGRVYGLEVSDGLCKGRVLIL